FTQVIENLRWPMPHAIVFRVIFEKSDKVLRAHPIDIAQRTAGKWRKTKADDRADIGLARIGDDALFHHARGLDRLNHEKALFELSYVDPVGIAFFRLETIEPGPQAL